MQCTLWGNSVEYHISAPRSASPVVPTYALDVRSITESREGGCILQLDFPMLHAWSVFPQSKKHATCRTNTRFPRAARPAETTWHGGASPIPGSCQVLSPPGQSPLDGMYIQFWVHGQNDVHVSSTRRDPRVRPLPLPQPSVSNTPQWFPLEISPL